MCILSLSQYRSFPSQTDIEYSDIIMLYQHKYINKLSRVDTVILKPVGILLKVKRSTSDAVFVIDIVP